MAKKMVRKGKYCPFDKASLYKTRRSFRYTAANVYYESVFQCAKCNRYFIFSDKIPYGMIPKPKSSLDDVFNLSKKYDENNLTNNNKVSLRKPVQKKKNKTIPEITVPKGKKLIVHVTETNATKCVVNTCDKELIKACVNPSMITVKKCPACGKVYCKYSVYIMHKDILAADTEPIEMAAKILKPDRNIMPTNQVLSQYKRVKPKATLKKTPEEGYEKNYIEKPKVTIKSNIPEKTNVTASSSKVDINNMIRNIDTKDFVVKGNTFQCRCKNHHLEDIAARIIIWSSDSGAERIETISAGYCGECNIYFIMDSTFKRLKNIGMIACRISNEKTYYKGYNKFNHMMLADESVLMQFGYSVSQQDGLTAQARHKILANLMDHKVMTKSEIISYLDFFINLNGNNRTKEKAISKWHDDKEFVEYYRLGDYMTFGVKGITRL